MIVSIIVIVLLFLMVYIGAHKLGGLQLLGVFVVLLLGLALVISPQLAGAAAAFMNVGRGADLLLYFGILAGLFITSNFYFRFKRNEQALIAIVRQQAIADASQQPHDPQHGTGTS